MVTQVSVLKCADVQFEFQEGIADSEQAGYMMIIKGSGTGYGPNGEVLRTRQVGDTTDNAGAYCPAGIVTTKADTDECQFLCASKIDNTPVVREEHRLTDGQQLTITNETKVLVVIFGEVRLNGVDFTGPEVIQIKSPSVNLVSIGDSFVSKLS